MSKLAKIPINLGEGISFKLEGYIAKIVGPKGTLTFKIPEGVKVELDHGKLKVGATEESNPNLKPLLGLTRAILNNMVIGVDKGFEKKLELSGVGYRAQAAGRDLTLSIGFSHPVKFQGKEGINFSVEENTITISGIDKELVGDTAAKIRALRPPEPYKGKGIKYKDEKIRRKAGKAAKALGATTK